jgi:capsular polysaccharide biosynthesis protein
MTRAPLGDAWFESELPTRIGLVAEVQRIRRRIAVRPLPALALALVITAGITHKFATKPVVVEANVVLALSEGVLSTHSATGVPADQLRQYFTTVLLPDAKLLELIERRDLFRLRKKLGPQFALDELRGNLGVQIWKNSFIYYDGDDQNAQRSARIGLTVTDSDSDRAFDIARDIATIAIQTSATERQKLADTLAHDVAVLHDTIDGRLRKLAVAHAEKQAAIDLALAQGKPAVARILSVDLAALAQQQRRDELRLSEIASSRDSLAGEIAAAGLDVSLTMVEEHRPERPTRSDLVLFMIAAVVGTGALIGSALVLGAFDSRVHDTDDVARLGLPVLGHVPGFAGDNVGAMQSRSAARARVPSFLRWRSHR